MAYEFQVVIDSQRPHEMADWWAQTLGWLVEPQDETFIRQMIAEGYATDNDTITHNGALVWRDGMAIRHPDELAGGGTRPRVLFQLVPEPRATKNRLHLDVRVGEENVEKQVDELTRRGAAVISAGAQGQHQWIVMADPEGNEFCVT
jgi:hypothetical protein